MHPNVAADFAPNNRIHAPNRSIDMHPKGIDMHPRVAAYMHPKVTACSQIFYLTSNLSIMLTYIFYLTSNLSIMLTFRRAMTVTGKVQFLEGP